MSSREVRTAVALVNASIRYGPHIREVAALLEELIVLVKEVDPLSKRKAWPKRLFNYLAEEQAGSCPECGGRLRRGGDVALHVDHVVPSSQGGDNSQANLRLLHARCNLLKGDGCNVDDVLRHLEGRLLNLRDVL